MGLGGRAGVPPSRPVSTPFFAFTWTHKPGPASPASPAPPNPGPVCLCVGLSVTLAALRVQRARPGLPWAKPQLPVPQLLQTLLSLESEGLCAPSQPFPATSRPFSLESRDSTEETGEHEVRESRVLLEHRSPCRLHSRHASLGGQTCGGLEGLAGCLSSRLSRRACMSPWAVLRPEGPEGRPHHGGHLFLCFLGGAGDGTRVLTCAGQSPASELHPSLAPTWSLMKRGAWDASLPPPQLPQTPPSSVPRVGSGEDAA